MFAFWAPVLDIFADAILACSNQTAFRRQGARRIEAMFGYWPSCTTQFSTGLRFATTARLIGPPASRQATESGSDDAPP